MRFMLDTSTCAYAMKQHPAVLRTLQSHRRSEITVSVVTEAELRFGAAKRNLDRHARAVEGLLVQFEVLPFTSVDAEVYAAIRATLERAGTPIGPLDMLIAAHAKAQRLVLVTSNEREFRRVHGLQIENWAA